MSTQVKQVKIITLEQLENTNIFKAGVPVVIKNGCQDWKASKKWNIEFFTKKYGDISVPLSNYKKDPYQSNDKKSSILIKDYLKDIVKMKNGETTGSEDLYSVGWHFPRNNKELLEDLNIPSTFKDNWATKVQDILYFETTALLFGHPKVESPMHTDSFFVSTWIASIVGQKRMRLVEPKYRDFVHNGYNIYDDKKLEELLEKDVEVYDCVIEQGDIIWFPPGWWHHVRNDTFTIAVTVNFVSNYHFLPFEQQVRSTLLRPLLALNKLKEESISLTAKSANSYEGMAFTNQNLIDSNYISLEKRYAQFFRKLTDKTFELIEHVQR